MVNSLVWIEMKCLCCLGFILFYLQYEEIYFTNQLIELMIDLCYNLISSRSTNSIQTHFKPTITLREIFYIQQVSRRLFY